MKVLQYVVCGIALTIPAAAQTASPAPASSTTPPATPATAPKPASSGLQLNTLGGDAVKGPEHPLTLEQSTQIYEVLGYQKQIDQNRTAMLAQQKQRAPFIPQDVWDDLEATSKKVDYPAAFHDVYKKYLSTEDAEKLIEFSKTDAGKHFLENDAAISRESAQAIQKQQQQVGMEVQGRHKDEIDAALKKYREEHQPKPAPSLGGATPTPGTAAPASPSGSTPAATPAPSTTPAQSTPPPATTPKN